MIKVSNITRAKLPSKARIVWARRCTRWHVYPCRQPLQLAAHDWSGWWLPSPEGFWFKAPSSYIIERDATDADAGAWQAEEVTARVTIQHFVREGSS